MNASAPLLERVANLETNIPGFTKGKDTTLIARVGHLESLIHDRLTALEKKHGLDVKVCALLTWRVERLEKTIPGCKKAEGALLISRVDHLESLPVTISKQILLSWRVANLEKFPGFAKTEGALFMPANTSKETIFINTESADRKNVNRIGVCFMHDLGGERPSFPQRLTALEKYHGLNVAAGALNLKRIETFEKAIPGFTKGDGKRFNNRVDHLESFPANSSTEIPYWHDLVAKHHLDDIDDAIMTALIYSKNVKREGVCFMQALRAEKSAEVKIAEGYYRRGMELGCGG